MLKLTPLRIVFVYVVLSVLWITSSDILVATVATSPRMYAVLSIAKGWLFILVTAMLLYGLILRYALERNRAEETLKESEARFRDLADSLPQTVFEMDEQGTFTYVNKNGLNAFGYTPADIAAGVNVMQIIAPEDRQKTGEAMAMRMRGALQGYLEYTGLRKDGSAFPMIVHSTAIMRHDRPSGLRGIAIDISDRKRMEQELLKTQKLESLGVLAGGIAHDFNNILTAILGNVALVRMRSKPEGFEYQRLKEAEKASMHAKDLTQQLLTFSKGGEPIKRTISLERVVRDSAGFALRGTKDRCEFHFEEGLWTVDADAGQLSQVFNNLVINACQAMPDGGLVTIGARNVTGGPRDGLTLPSGRYVQVTVQDQGIGIPEEHFQKVFDPFFTTKQSGSGLGLAVTYSIIKGHNGHITVASKPGAGATFTILLPASGRQPSEQRPAADIPPAGSGRVLVMDDEEMVRNVAGVMLRELGYDVSFARDGAEAVRMYGEAAGSSRPFDVVFMDLTIPGGMGGREAILQLRQMDPGVKAIATSGYSNDPVMANFGDYGFNGVVAKPYNFAELGKVLHDVLGG